jgi:hypothetical protein
MIYTDYQKNTLSSSETFNPENPPETLVDFLLVSFD